MESYYDPAFDVIDDDRRGPADQEIPPESMHPLLQTICLHLSAQVRLNQSPEGDDELALFMTELSPNLPMSEIFWYGDPYFVQASFCREYRHCYLHVEVGACTLFLCRPQAATVSLETAVEVYNPHLQQYNLAISSQDELQVAKARITTLVIFQERNGGQRRDFDQIHMIHNTADWARFVTDTLEVMLRHADEWESNENEEDDTEEESGGESD